MNKYLHKLFLLLFFIGLLGTGPASAGTEPYENFLKGVIRKGDTLRVKDEKFRNTSYNWGDITNTSVNNTLTLRLLDESQLTRDFSCEVQLKVSYFSTPGQQTPTVIEGVSLKINYTRSQGANYKITDTYAFSGGHQVTVTVTGISSPEYGENLPGVLQLTNSIMINRQYRFKEGDPINPHVDFSQAAANSGSKGMRLMRMEGGSSLENNNTQLQLTWPLQPGAEEYDIEWTTIDQGSQFEGIITAMQSGSTVGDSLLNTLFRNNATRVTTHDNTYRVSLVYNADYIAVRMRQVQYQADGIRLEGDWDYQLDDDDYALWPITWHEKNKNWQYSSAFAEGGKKKEVVSYYDGTLRGRQTVSINNTDSVSVVQEKVYDESGREAASILPAPAKTNPSGNEYLHYVATFNQNAQGKPYSFGDIASSDSLACSLNPFPLNSTSGAALYYSENNPFLPSGKRYNRLIPNSGGYPFSVTQYTPDNTGRIRMQGGVGRIFQPGDSAGKVTKYYYGKPEQWELDRLFGNDVGYANHYLKNMTVDPNGQVSVSYLNASGKTIATALAGNAPDNVDSLSSIARQHSENIKLLTPDRFTFKTNGLKLTATTTYLASVTGPARLEYNVKKLISRYPGEGFEPCSNCSYTLNIKVTNDCNAPIYFTIEPVKIGKDIADSLDVGLHQDTLDLNIPQIGEYYITFDLALNAEAIDYFTREFVSQGQQTGKLKKEFDFVKNYLDSLQLSDCFADCSTCEDLLGTQSAFTQSMAGKLIGLGVDSTAIVSSTFTAYLDQKYIQLKDNCTLISQSCYTAASPCSPYEVLMKQDVLPGGQYALFDTAGNVLEPAIHILNNYWRIEFPVAQAGSPQYEAGLITLEDGSTTSVYAESFTLKMFVHYWKDEWAEKFLRYHPEYCKLEFCRNNSASYSWDEYLKEQVAGADEIPGIPGETNLQYNENNASWLLAADPFFKTGTPGAVHYAAMKADLDGYSAKVLNYSAAEKGLTQFVDYMLYCSDLNGTTNSSGNGTNQTAWNSCTPDPLCRVSDREWDYYRDTYLQIKDKYYKLLRESTTCITDCPVGTPVNPSQPGSISINNFTVEKTATSATNCNTGEQQVEVRYDKYWVRKVTTVKIYYPGQTTPVTLTFAVGEGQKALCVPGSLPVSSIKISEVSQ